MNHIINYVKFIPKKKIHLYEHVLEEWVCLHRPGVSFPSIFFKLNQLDMPKDNSVAGGRVFLSY